MKDGPEAAWIVVSILLSIVMLIWLLHCIRACSSRIRINRMTDSGDIEMNADSDVTGGRTPDLALPTASHQSDRELQRI